MIIDTASKILLWGGFLMLAVGIGTGFAMGRVRETEPDTPKYLRFAHMSGYMQAPILFGLVVAVAASDLSAWLETLAASLIVAGAVLLAVKDLINWRTNVEDEFRTRPLGYWLGALMVPLHIAGLVILAVGALS